MMDKIYFYQTVEDALVRLKLESVDTGILVESIPLAKKTAYWAISNRVSTYCLDKGIKEPWVGSKFILKAKDIHIIKVALGSKASDPIVHTICVKKVGGNTYIVKTTDIYNEGFDHYFYSSKNLTAKQVSAILSPYKSNKGYAITLEALNELLLLDREATKKDFPYVEEKPVLATKALKSKGAKAYFIYEYEDNYKIVSTFSSTEVLEYAFSLPRDSKASILSLLEKIGADKSGILTKDQVKSLIKEIFSLTF